MMKARESRVQGSEVCTARLPGSFRSRAVEDS